MAIDTLARGMVNKVSSQLAEIMNQGGNVNLPIIRKRYGGTNIGVRNGMQSQVDDISDWDSILAQVKPTKCHIKIIAGHIVDYGTTNIYPSDRVVYNNSNQYGALLHGLQKCVELGITVDMLCFYLSNDSSHWADEVTISTGQEDNFFNSMKAWLLQLAGFCNTYNVPILNLGNERPALSNTTHVSRWQTIISEIRTTYPNLKLCYTTTTWNRETRNLLDHKLSGGTNIYDMIDYIGVNAYPVITTKDINTVTHADLVKGWYGMDYPSNSTMDCSYADLLWNLHKAYNKPVMITEIGCVNKENGLQDPGGLSVAGSGTTVNLTPQTLYIKTAYEILGNADWIEAIYLWDTWEDTGTNPFNWLRNPDVVSFITEYYGGVFHG